ncbi:MAG TPA: carbohydrate kinase family protein [Pyrinomonadaceae bacterium]|nr:carbohydrate kinase family protein [Pyrinomonadaceae bacterium]
MNLPFQLRETAPFDVAGFGTNAVDFLITVPSYPAFGSKIELDHYLRFPGGEIATTLSGLQRLGASTTYAGRFGDDDAGDFGIESLRMEGVDVAHCERIEGAATQIAFIVIDAQSGERTVIWKRDARLRFTSDAAPLDVARSAKVLHMTPHDGAACVAMAKAARDAGTLVSVDLDNLFEATDELLRLTDILIVSSDMPRRLFGTIEIEEGLRKLEEMTGAGVVGITQGEEGSLLLCGGQFIKTPGFRVPGVCRDTTGAGDAFRTGLLYGVLRGYSVEECARVANAVAALNCREVGARTALPNLEELHEILG